jgi:hypothetical protein
MPAINNIKLTIGGPESAPGQAAARTHVIPVRGLTGPDKTAERIEDPAITGQNMAVGEYFTADSIAGAIPLAIRPCAGIGKLIKSALGSPDTSPPQIGACIEIRYKGSSASCKLVANTTTNTLKSYIGALGSETLDSGFGTAGSIDLMGGSYDAVGELVAYIDGLADYECKKIAGQDSAVSADIIDGTLQAKNMWAFFWFVGTTGIYLHKFSPVLDNTERPTYSLQKDGYQSNFLYVGCVVDTLNLSAALKAFAEGECNILGFTETDAQTASGLTLEDVDPLIFSKGSFSLAAKEYAFIRNMSLAIANNHNAEGYGQGSTSRQYNQKGKLDITGDFQLRLDADSYLERVKVFDGSQVGISFYFKGKTIATDITELMIIELPFAVLREPAWPENAGQIDIKLGYRAINPKGTKYNEPLTISLLTKDSGAY